MNEQKVAVIMSTYNGERYVSEQIESIFKQSGVRNVSIKLFVRDDGSSDATLGIVRKLQKQYNIQIVENQGINLGVKQSFFVLLDFVTEYDYVFFSDQDDIWPENKVQVYLKYFKEYNSGPVGIYSDGYVSDANAKPTDVKLSEYFRWSSVIPDYEYLLYGYIVTGATFAINQATLTEIQSIPRNWISEINMHDSFIAEFVALIGTIVRIDEPLLYYRQHASNVIGAKSVQRNVFGKIRNSKALLRGLFRDHTKIIQLTQNYEMTPKIMIYRNFSKAINGSLSAKLRFLIQNFRSIWWTHPFIVAFYIMVYRPDK